MSMNVMPDMVSEEVKNDNIKRLTMIQKERDTRLHSALKKHGIRTWPMNDKKFDKNKKTIEDISNELNDPNMYIMFIVKDDYDKPEKECYVLSNGTWNRFSNTTEALRTMYDMEDDHDMSISRIVYDKGNA